MLTHNTHWHTAPWAQTHIPTHKFLYICSPFTHTSVYIQTHTHTHPCTCINTISLHMSLNTYSTHTRHSVHDHTHTAHRRNQAGIWTWVKKLGHFIISQFQWGDWGKFSCLVNFFYRSIDDLQCCIKFCCAAKWLRHVYAFFLTFFSIMVYP